MRTRDFGRFVGVGVGVGVGEVLACLAGLRVLALSDGSGVRVGLSEGRGDPVAREAPGAGLGAL
ncbi:hypothetical protein DQ392_17915 [Streptomyces reniochalinae]|uniref:Uncharacterized protein n=1 Tax=Streptomyces reniochalinae TaxID=2250578 RepID=A0A367EH38_9ACTN|nr:hypothetical protein DQ392_17915 [Streptomyces reniochalinae]